MHAPPLSPWQEAEQARQVVNVLARIEQRFTEGRWDSGYRFSPRGGNCLIGAIDEATSWVLPGVTERVTAELTARLPAPFRVLAMLRPRLALALYNDTVGGRNGALTLVRDARYALGGLPMITFVGEARPQPWSSGTRPSAAGVHWPSPDAPERRDDAPARREDAPVPGPVAPAGSWTAMRPSPS